jgi:hypothetical protein
MAKRKKGRDKSGDKMRTYDGDLLQGRDIPRGLIKRYNLKRARYWCNRFRQELLEGDPAEGAPEGFKEFVEALPDFGGWRLFADSWDLRGGNPFMVVYRLQSVWDEWDSVMLRVSIPLDLDAKARHMRMKALEEAYQKK